MMNDQFTWGQGQTQSQKVVAMTAADAQNLVTVIVRDVSKAVVERNAVDALEAYKQAARVEAELVRAREELARKNHECEGLRNHINTLNGFIANMSNGAGVQHFNPYNNGSAQAPGATTYQVPTFDGRVSAQAPVPPLAPWTPVVPAAVPTAE